MSDNISMHFKLIFANTIFDVIAGDKVIAEFIY